MTEKTRLGSCTVTIPPLKSCTSGTKSQPLWISLIKDDSLARVLREGAVADDVSRIVTEGTSSVQTDTGEVTKALTKRTVVVRATVLGVAWSALTAVRTLIFWTVDMKMPLVVTLKTNSCRSCDGLWAQPGITRQNLSGI